MGNPAMFPEAIWTDLTFTDDSATASHQVKHELFQQDIAGLEADGSSVVFRLYTVFGDLGATTANTAITRTDTGVKRGGSIDLQRADMMSYPVYSDWIRFTAGTRVEN